MNGNEWEMKWKGMGKERERNGNEWERNGK